MRLAAIVAVSLALLVLGARLVRLSRRTGGRPPERWLGLAFVCFGASAWLLPLAASGGLAHERARLLGLTAQTGISLAVALLVVFAWRVFRPGSRPAGWLAATLIGANAVACGAVLAGGAPVPTGGLGFAVVLPRSAALLWLFLESTIYAVRMRRRLALGLADPIVANRFLLWSIWTGALALMPLFVMMLRALGGLEAPDPGAPLPAGVRTTLHMFGAGGAVAAAAGWLAFFPPAAYRRWIGASVRA